MPYWRLSAFYFFYFASLGILIPYWSLYLESMDYSAMEIGELMTILMVTKIFSPYLWAWFSDRFGHIIQILRLGTFLTALVFFGFFFLDGFWALAFVMALFSFFWNAVLPQFEVITLRYLHNQLAIYSQIRLWGSVGFIVAVICLGVGIESLGIEIILPILLSLYITLWLVSHLIKEPSLNISNTANLNIKKLLKNRVVMALLMVCFLMQMGHGAYYSFYSILLSDIGYSKIMIGFLWSLAVIAEIIVFIYMQSLMKQFNIINLLIFSLFLALIRWLLIALFYHSFIFLMIAQLMHAATFGIFHATAIHLINEYFSGANQGRGQALYSSIGFGLGGAFGSLLTGYYWDALGAGIIFIGSAVISFLALLVAWIFMTKRNDLVLL